MSEKDISKIDDLIASFDTAILVTESLHGELRGRPMTLAGHHRGSVLYFFSRDEDEKLNEIERRPDVNVVMQKDGLYLSVSGRAKINTRSDLIKQFWSEPDRLWFPKGPKDPNLKMIEVEPCYAECWDRTGIRKLEFWWEAGKALLKQRKAADDKLGGHLKIEL